VRIDQVIPVLRRKNAVGIHTLNVQQALWGEGIESEIFYEEAEAETSKLGKPLSEFADAGENRRVLFQAAIGSPAFEVVRRMSDPLVINYHNITPSELIAPWEPEIAAVGLSNGRKQLSNLVRHCDLALAVSTYNERELIDLGFKHTAVAPLLIDMRPSSDIDEELLRHLTANKTGASLLYVGQISPHKAPHDLVAMLALLREQFLPEATLTLVGQSLGQNYPEALEAYISNLGLSDAVHIVGEASPRVLEAYWRSADLYVSASEHEGFCAPLIEAMGHELPIVAFASAAIPDTVNDAGLLLRSKEPLVFAGAVNRVLGDEVLRHQLVSAGRSRAQDFDLEKSTRQFLDALMQRD
jgi:L-malate glycosyltransferase